MTGLAIRRHHAERLNSKRRNYWNNPQHRNREATAKTCSCYLCGNPRKVFKGKRPRSLTRQELVADYLATCWEKDFNDGMAA